MPGITPSHFQRFSRAEWSGLRASTPMTLDEADLAELRGINEHLSLDEVADVYLPLSRLLNLYVSATQQLHAITHAFLGSPVPRVAYVIGVAGSVAVGKSTTARVLQALLARWPDHPRVDLITTDGFLYPNAVLEARGLMGRKGFPESYDLRRLLTFLAAVKGGEPKVSAPVYSHHAYDIIPAEEAIVRTPDVLIVEGLNVLQGGNGPVVSDYFDFSVYVDAEEADIEQWYIDRFLTLRETAFRDETAFFHRFAGLSVEDSIATARSIWRDINGVNLVENILPTRERADLILEKGSDHAVTGVRLRRV
jgi:type I pantothenate kinase